MNGSKPDATDAFALDAAWARRAFDRASTGYDAAAVLQAEVRQELLGRLEFTALEPRLVLDAGAGTGHASRALKRRYPQARVIALDTSAGMLRRAARQRRWLRPFDRLLADAECLPLAAASVDLIYSNFLLEWCDPERTFAEFRRVLAPRGLLMFSSLGPDTLMELRAAWGAVDGGRRVHRFRDMHDIGDALVRAGFAAPVLDVERYTLTYADVRALAADLKALGAHNASLGRPRGLTGRRKFTALQAAYETHRRDGRLPATYEIIYAQAWTPLAPPSGPTTSERVVSLDEVKAELRERSRR